MPNLNVVVLGSSDIVKELGKKGTSTDITFYNLKKGADTITLIEPTRYPEKLSSLFFSVSLADMAIICIEAITPQIGEIFVMLHVAGMKQGYIILRNYLDPGQFAPLIKNTVLESYEFILDDPALLRERLIELAGQLKANTAGTLVVPIDHHFNVRGIGTVVLGTVKSGTIKKHDTVVVYPTGKKIQVRSIQKHDDDVDEAYCGDRVGLALKGIDAEELDRGYVLSDDPFLKSDTEVRCKAEIVPYWSQPLKEQMVLYIGYWMQFLPCRIKTVISDKDWRSAELTLSCDKEFVYTPGSTAVIHYLEAEKLRVVGTIILS